MKKFTFELEQVLEYRNFEKQQAEGELAKCIAVEAEINQNLEQIAMQYASMNQKMRGNLNFSDMMSQSQHRKLLEYQKEELLNQLAQAKLETEAKRKILSECMKKTTALEKLKETQFAEYKAEIDRAEKKRLEEIATVKGFVK